ncbi:hypothetical protein Tco_0126192, partial [Tanacetum coccineum]
TTVTTTTTLLLPPPPQQQSSSDANLASRVSALEQVCANFEKRHKLQDKTVQSLSSMVFTGTYQSQPKHVALYKALEASMIHDNKDEFLEETIKSCKGHRDDQDPPQAPPKDSDQSKKSRHESDASGSKQPLAP